MSSLALCCSRAIDRGGVHVPRAARKALSYALMHLGVAMAVAFALTRSWQAALAIGTIEPLVQTVAYSVHERVWSRKADS